MAGVHFLAAVHFRREFILAGVHFRRQFNLAGVHYTRQFILAGVRYAAVHFGGSIYRTSTATIELKFDRSDAY